MQLRSTSYRAVLCATFLALSAATLAEESRKLEPIVSIDGVEHKLFADEKTIAVALMFIVTDCPIANSYAPEFNRLHADYAARGVQLFLVHADPELKPAAAAEHAKEYQLKPPVAVDGQQKWARLVGARVTPEAAVFSRSGELLYRGRIDDRYAGLGKRRSETTSRELRDSLDAILAGHAVPERRTEAIGCPIPNSNTFPKVE